MSLLAQYVERYPAAMLGLGTPGLTATEARDRLAAIAQVEPATAADLAFTVALTALGLIRDGHPRAGEVATFALTVCSAKPWGLTS